VQCNALHRLSYLTPLIIVLGQEKSSRKTFLKRGVAMSYHSRCSDVQVQCQQQRQRDHRADVLPEPAHSAPHMIRTHARQGEASTLVATAPGVAHHSMACWMTNTSAVSQARPAPVCLACTQGPACAWHWGEERGRECAQQAAHLSLAVLVQRRDGLHVDRRRRAVREQEHHQEHRVRRRHGARAHQAQHQRHACGAHMQKRVPACLSNQDMVQMSQHCPRRKLACVETAGGGHAPRQLQRGTRTSMTLRTRPAQNSGSFASTILHSQVLGRQARVSAITRQLFGLKSTWRSACHGKTLCTLGPACSIARLHRGLARSTSSSARTAQRHEQQAQRDDAGHQARGQARGAGALVQHGAQHQHHARDHGRGQQPQAVHQRRQRRARADQQALGGRRAPAPPPRPEHPPPEQRPRGARTSTRLRSSAGSTSARRRRAAGPASWPLAADRHTGWGRSGHRDSTRGCQGGLVTVGHESQCCLLQVCDMKRSTLVKRWRSAF
jgi:hypothetical protein